MDLCSLRDIKPLLERHGFHTSKALGQNFLIASWVPERIAEESGVTEEHGVLEIGPGVGCLTKELSLLASKVTAVELDRRLPPLLKESLADCGNVEIISGDIMDVDLKTLTEEKFPGLTPVVCANLPYNITSPVLSKLIDSKLFDSITVMIQREVAQRICARPGTSDYGAFSVYVNYYTEPEILFDVSPGCFFPPPKVTSSVIKLIRRSAPPAEVHDEALFFRLVKASFAQRRKTLVNGLSSAVGGKLTKQELLDIIIGCGFDEKVRGETLGIPEFAVLSNAVGEALK